MCKFVNLDTSLIHVHINRINIMCLLMNNKFYKVQCICSVFTATCTSLYFYPNIFFSFFLFYHLQNVPLKLCHLEKERDREREREREAMNKLFRYYKWLYFCDIILQENADV